MNESEERLQEILEKLEHGEAQAEVLAEIPESEAELAALAVALLQTDYPELPEETAVSQRATLQRLHQTSLSTPAARQAGWLARLRDWWQAQSWQLRRGWVTAVVTMLLIVLVVGLGNLSSSGKSILPVDVAVQDDTTEQLIAQLPEPEAGQPESVVPDTENPASALAASHAGEAVYIPLISFPVDSRPETAVIEDIHGLVEMQNDFGEWTAVAQLQSLAEGQRLRTGALSRARLTFFDGSQVNLGPNSELSLDVVNAQLPDVGLRTVIMTQLSGESEHHVQFRNDNGSRYEVKTSYGSGIARGTIFQVQVTEDLKALYAVSEGLVDVSGAGTTVSVRPGKVSTILAEAPPTPPAFRVTGEGEVTQIGMEWMIGGQTFQVDEQTVIVGDPQVGDWVLIEGHLLPDGSRLADRITLVNRTPVNRFAITGQVEAVGADSWKIAGQVVAVNEDTMIDSAAVVGDIVRVTGLVQGDGSLFAERIRLVESDAGFPFEFTGIVQSMDGEAWLISGVAITTNGATEIKDEIAVGDVVKVEGFIENNGMWLAEEIKLSEVAESKFEISGLVNTVSPWMVAGVPFEVDDQTEIEAEIAAGDLVKVEGRILLDGTWLADEIKLLTEEDQLTFEFYGTVDSTDSWVVSGIALPVTAETAVDENIQVGDLVRVTITITPDGSWLVESIVLVNDAGDDAGCFSVTAVVRSFSDDQLAVDNWPVFQMGKAIELAEPLQPGSVITLYACVDESGLLVILDIIILSVPGTGDTPVPQPTPGDGEAKVTICHKPDSKNAHTIVINQSAVPAHLNHGDKLGACP